MYFLLFYEYIYLSLHPPHSQINASGILPGQRHAFKGVNHRCHLVVSTRAAVFPPYAVFLLLLPPPPRRLTRRDAVFLCDVVRGRRRLFHRRRYHHRQRPRLHARFLLDIRSVLILFVVVEDFPSFLLVLFALQTRRFLSSYVSFLPRRRRCGRNHRRRRRRGRKRDVDGCTVLDSTRHQSAASKRNGVL